MFTPVGSTWNNLAVLLLAMALIAAIAGMTIAGAHSRYAVRIAFRQVRRRPGRNALIVFGLMLATTFIAGALILNDTIVLAVQQVAVYSLGRVDEEVVNRSGILGFYPIATTDVVRAAVAGDAQVVGVTPALAVPDLLIVDEASRQVRGNVLGIGIAPGGGPLTNFTSVNSRQMADVNDLASDEVYLNSNAARLLSAQPGDSLLIYSSLAPGSQYHVRVRAIVSGGALARLPSLVTSLPTLQAFFDAEGRINRIYIANAGDGLSGVGYSDAIATRINKVLPNGLSVRKVKQEGVSYALQAQEVFGRILVLYTLFALAISLLLIFIIFALLAAERRVEMGIERALGMHRFQVVEVLLFEGAFYATVASIPGVVAGIGLGILIVRIVTPTIAQFGLPLTVSIRPESSFLALSLGLLFTFVATVAVVSVVSGMNISAAMRGLPDPPMAPKSLRSLVRGVFTIQSGESAFTSIIYLLWGLAVRGIIPLLLGWLLVRYAVEARNVVALALGIPGALAGMVLIIRWLTLVLLFRLMRTAATHTLDMVQSIANRLSALLIGSTLVLYWSLPFATLRQLGLPRVPGGIELLFIAGVMMIAGAVLGIAPNLDILFAPLRWLSKRTGQLRHVSYVAFVYPSHQRVRSGLTISMFSLVTFTMVVMACVAASTVQRYGNFGVQAGGYNIIGQPLFRPIGSADQVSQLLDRSAPATSNDVSAISSATPLPLIMFQPDATTARWAVYPASEIQGAFLYGQGLPLVARAPQFASDAAVWQSVRTQPGNVVIDVGALSDDDAGVLGISAAPGVGIKDFVAPPIASGLLGLASLEALLGQSSVLNLQRSVPPDIRHLIEDQSALDLYTLHLQHIALGQGSIVPTTLWIADPRGGAPERVSIIGIVDNAHGQSYGLLGSPQTFASVEQGQPLITSAYYYFKLRAGANVHADAISIGSALLNYGFQTTVIEDALEDLNGPQVFASRVLIGLVGLTLLIGMVALAIIGLRAVVERRQQIGMLRALGFRKTAVGTIFVLEAILIAIVGASLGLILGLTLARNVFAVNFFVRIQSGLTLVVPWAALIAIIGTAVIVAVGAALAPARKASLVAPAEALRYE